MIKPNESTAGGIGLKTLRELLGGISQEELGRRISASVRTVHRWESGHKAQLSVPQVKALDALLESVGLRFKDLSDDLSVDTNSANS
ncbi:MAG: helix-turn-helix transcriptional regulator [Cyanobacteria bacterium P01_F01_bin.3]